LTSCGGIALIAGAEIIVIAGLSNMQALTIIASVSCAEVIVIAVNASALIVAVRNWSVGASGQRIAVIRGAIIIVIATDWGIGALPVGAGISSAEVVIIAIHSCTKVIAIWYGSIRATRKGIAGIGCAIIIIVAIPSCVNAPG